MNMLRKVLNILATSSGVHNYFDGPTKLFSELYLAKFLGTSAKPFFPCENKFLIVSMLFDDSHEI